MAWTQADIDAIDEAIKSGALRVQFADRLMIYRSIDELIKARSQGLQQLDSASAGGPGTGNNRQYRFWSRNGW